MSKVSILVAVHNASSTLDKCLDSLKSQTLSDIQIICVDDCSTDNSLDVLRHHAALDDRISIIHLDENRGQAHARNEGMKIADGEYVCMLDADDWFSPDALQKAVETFEDHPETDVVLFKLILAYPDHNEAYRQVGFDRLSGMEAFGLALNWSIHGVYMERSEIQRRFPYDETCRLYSDDNTTLVHYAVAREVRECMGIYYYRQHSASSTHSVNVRRFDILKAQENMRRLMSGLNIPENMVAKYENVRWLTLIDVYMFYHCFGKNLSETERKYGIGEIKRMWRNIDKKVIDRKLATKFGYIPLPNWLLFRVQEWIYFTLRGFLGRNP